jgi:hypothetical protein
MLSDARLDELQVKHGKIGMVEYCGHAIVFRKPSREIARDYRRKKDSVAEAPDALDQLAQATIVAFDDEDDPNKARVRFTGEFLEEYPLATSHPRFVTCLSVLSGLAAEEDDSDLGKGVSVRSGRQRTSQKV